MEIIRFPGADPAKAVKVETSVDPSNKMVLGPMNFTCTSCGEPCGADFRKIIFRSVEFHCAGCGTFFKISNPAFVIPTNRTRQK